jgi:hypothetical protein
MLRSELEFYPDARCAESLKIGALYLYTPEGASNNTSPLTAFYLQSTEVLAKARIATDSDSMRSILDDVLAFVARLAELVTKSGVDPRDEMAFAQALSERLPFNLRATPFQGWPPPKFVDDLARAGDPTELKFVPIGA